jgi:1,6-anhydro-N-acetylmuramate kinase
MPSHSESGAFYVGLMSGTSMDGIDAALVEFGDHRCEIRAALSAQYPGELRSALLKASRTPAECTVDVIGNLDRWIGECFRDAALALLKECDIAAAEVAAIGSHGQTLRHQPHAARPFTLQISLQQGPELRRLRISDEQMLPWAAKAHRWRQRFISGCSPKRMQIAPSSISVASPT